MNDLPYRIALTMIDGIGPVKARRLLLHCGSAEAVFREKSSHLEKIPDIGYQTIRLLKNDSTLKKAEAEIQFMEHNHVLPLFFTDINYPDRLKQCADAPLMLYTKGKINLNARRVISIVGTRTATSYGKEFCGELLRGITGLQPLVISGLAYGIDVCAHRNAINCGLPTVACVAHGLEKIYPPLHSPVAHEMMKNGGLVSEFHSGTRMNPELFPMRNRIIAGLSDCTIVMETDMKGGSMITANFASSYDREVFAVPGRFNDRESSGCNELIRRNIAAILTSPQELISYMGWEENQRKKSVQLPLELETDPAKSEIIRVLMDGGRVTIDNLSIAAGKPLQELSVLLLEMEFKGVVKSLPGKQFELGKE